jgi:hypothetical protein
MCGTNSLEIVFGITSGKQGAQVKFVLHGAELGTSHSEIRTAHKIASTRRYVNVHYLGNNEFQYENGTPSWFTAKMQASVEKQIANIVDKVLPAYSEKLVKLDVAHDKAIENAIAKADAALVVATKNAFAPLAKLGASQA